MRRTIIKAFLTLLVGLALAACQNSSGHRKPSIRASEPKMVKWRAKAIEWSSSIHIYELTYGYKAGDTVEYGGNIGKIVLLDSVITPK